MTNITLPTCDGALVPFQMPAPARWETATAGKPLARTKISLLDKQ